MSFFDSLRNLFSGSNTSQEPPASEEYNGYLIVAEPAEEQGQYRINGTISKGEQSQPFIRADILPSKPACEQETFRKARIMIDQNGDRLFGA